MPGSSAYRCGSANRDGIVAGDHDAQAQYPFEPWSPNVRPGRAGGGPLRSPVTALRCGLPESGEPLGARCACCGGRLRPHPSLRLRRRGDADRLSSEPPRALRGSHRATPDRRRSRASGRASRGGPSGRYARGGGHRRRTPAPRGGPRRGARPRRYDVERALAGGGAGPRHRRGVGSARRREWRVGGATVRERERDGGLQARHLRPGRQAACHGPGGRRATASVARRRLSGGGRRPEEKCV